MTIANATFSEIITFTRASAATYVNSTGDLTFEFLDDVPRFSYDPITLAPLGFLIEEQRYNQIINDFNTGSWQLANCTVDYDESVIDPAGGFSFGMTPTGGAGTIPQAFYVVDKTATAITYTVSLWVRGDVSSFSLTLDDGTTTNRGIAIFNLITGTLTSAVNDGNFTGTSATISAYKNSWYRITLTTTTNTTLFARFRFLYTATALNTPIVYLAYGQLEEGAFATSYINAISGPSVRAADVATINTLSPWYNAVEGTLYAKYITSNSVQNNNAVAISDGTANNRMIIRATNATVETAFIGVVGGVVQWNLVIGSALTNTITNSAFAYKNNDIAVVRNGGTIVPDTTATIPVVTLVKLGADGAGNQVLNGYLQKIIYYPKRLTNSEIQALTS